MSEAAAPATGGPSMVPVSERAAPVRPGSGERQKGWLDKVPGSRRATAFWMNFFFFCARWAPWFVRGSEWFWIGLSHVFFRRALRTGPRANAKWLLGPGATPRDIRRFETEVLRQFYRFIEDVGRAKDLSPAEILSHIGDHRDGPRRLVRGRYGRADRS